jgi:hypothetical protein
VKKFQSGGSRLIQLKKLNRAAALTNTATSGDRLSFIGELEKPLMPEQTC